MAKSYIDILKYMIEAKFEISGIVEKPDIVGAVFGQTEGLLGSELDLRELQKNGKIGRIEIDVTSSSNRTFGKLLLPSSLPRVDTCILGAAIESVDKVGPFETHFVVEKIEDTRNIKRQHIITRAKSLLKMLLETEIPDSKELSEMVESSVKSSNITTYGPESLPCAPGIDKKEEIVLVEGRADVINLLKNDVDNCIAIGGAAGTIPKTIISLCATKDATLFVDGDRGGDMIIKSVMSNCEIDYIAKAPDGKEVEELTRKEIIKSIRSRIPAEQLVGGSRFAKPASNGQQQRTDRPRQLEQHERQQERAPQQRQDQRQQRSEQQPIMSPSAIAQQMRSVQHQQRHETEGFASMDDSDIKSIYSNDEKEGMEGIPMMTQPSSKREAVSIDPVFITALEELKNTLRGRIYDHSNKLINEVPVREIIQAIQDANQPHAVVFDGIITQRLVELANKKGISAIYGIRSAQLIKRYDNILIHTSEPS